MGLNHMSTSSILSSIESDLARHKLKKKKKQLKRKPLKSHDETKQNAKTFENGAVPLDFDIQMKPIKSPKKTKKSSSSSIVSKKKKKKEKSKRKSKRTSERQEHNLSNELNLESSPGQSLKSSKVEKKKTSSCKSLKPSSASKSSPTMNVEKSWTFPLELSEEVYDEALKDDSPMRTKIKKVKSKKKERQSEDQRGRSKDRNDASKTRTSRTPRARSVGSIGSRQKLPFCPIEDEIVIPHDDPALLVDNDRAEKSKITVGRPDESLKSERKPKTTKYERDPQSYSEKDDGLLSSNSPDSSEAYSGINPKITKILSGQRPSVQRQDIPGQVHALLGAIKPVSSSDLNRESPIPRVPSSWNGQDSEVNSEGQSPISTSKADAIRYFEALATPSRMQRKLLPDDLHTPKARRRIINSLNMTPATPSKKANAPPRKRDLGSFLQQDKDSERQGFLDAAVALLQDKSKESEVASLVKRISDANGFPKTRRLSMRDNDFTCDLIHSIQNKPTVTQIRIDSDAVFGTVSTTLLFQFVGSLRINLHLTALQFRGVELGNDFLYALAATMESNFVLKKIDLSKNCFTNEGLAEFCQAIGNFNETCKTLNLKDQTTPISVASQDSVLDAFRKNKSLIKVKLDFQSEDGEELLGEIMKGNRKKPIYPIKDEKLLTLLKDEVEVAEELANERKVAEEILQVPDHDWGYLYELALLFDKHKLKREIQALEEGPSENQKIIKANENLTGKQKSEFLFGKFKDILEDSVACFNQDGSFLTDEFIAKFLVEEEDTSSIVFDFNGQWKLFKRFPPEDPFRSLIVTKFVNAIVTHPRANEFTGINMANTGCGNDFLITLSQRLLEDCSLLPNLQMINFETNYINEPGVSALAKLIANPHSAKYLQVVRLENQNSLLKSKGELALMKAMCVNRSVVVLGLRIRNLLERQQIGKYLLRNIDFIRKGRQHHKLGCRSGENREGDVLQMEECYTFVKL